MAGGQRLRPGDVVVEDLAPLRVEVQTGARHVALHEADPGRRVTARGDRDESGADDGHHGDGERDHRRSPGDDHEHERDRDEGDGGSDERRPADRCPAGEGGLRLREGDAGPREAAVGQRAAHPLLQDPQHGDEEGGGQLVPGPQQRALHRREHGPHEGHVERLEGRQGEPRELADEDPRPAEGRDEAGQAGDEPEEEADPGRDIPQRDADEGDADDREVAQVVVGEGQPQAQAADEGEQQPDGQAAEGHSHGVVRTIVVRVETPPSLRTRARSSSRSWGVPTRTRSR